jgi:hypothetical protein
MGLSLCPADFCGRRFTGAISASLQSKSGRAIRRACQQEPATNQRPSRLRWRRFRRVRQSSPAMLRGGQHLQRHRQLPLASRRRPRSGEGGCRRAASRSRGAGRGGHRARGASCPEFQLRCRLRSGCHGPRVMPLNGFVALVDKDALITEATLRHRVRPVFPATATGVRRDIRRRLRSAHSGRPHQVGEDRHRRARAAQLGRSRTEIRLRLFLGPCA